jgi:hypothetical protein
MTCHHITKRTERIVIFLVAGLLAVLAVSISGTSCAGAPKNLDQMASMEESDWQAYLLRVGAWSEAAGYSVVKAKPEEYDHIVAYSDLLASASAEGPADPISDAATKIAWATPMAKLVLLEGKALLDARGGLPAGQRGLALLHAIASGVRAGAEDAFTEPK